MIGEHPLPWLAPLLNGVEHANFFETRATEYSKGATRGDWNTVWNSFDGRKKAKHAELSGSSIEAEADSADMFADRSEEHTSELQSLMRISYAVFCLKKKKQQTQIRKTTQESKKKYKIIKHS